MNARSRNLLLAITGALLVAALLLRAPMGEPALSEPSAGARTAPTPPLPTTSAPVTPFRPVGRDPSTYAFDISTLSGFPPDAEPGDVFDFWVAWDQGVVKGPNVQLLLKKVELERIAPPVIPGGPYAAIFIVTRGQARNLYYGERYGTLSVSGAAT